MGPSSSRAGPPSGGRRRARGLPSHWRCSCERPAGGCGCSSLYSEGVICRPSRGATFVFRGCVPTRRLPYTLALRVVRGGRRTGAAARWVLACIERGLCSDGSLPETVFARVAARRSQNDTQSAIQARADRETQRNCNHSCPDSTIANNQSCCVVAASGTAVR